MRSQRRDTSLRVLSTLSSTPPRCAELRRSLGACDPTTAVLSRTGVLGLVGSSGFGGESAAALDDSSPSRRGPSPGSPRGCRHFSVGCVRNVTVAWAFRVASVLIGSAPTTRLFPGDQHGSLANSIQFPVVSRLVPIAQMPRRFVALYPCLGNRYSCVQQAATSHDFCRCGRALSGARVPDAQSAR
ncbi:hypothetical protein HPB50_021730 [Hyalomma asiaticum]|uniref:Uncharacterized protein n=1 Tax=Hyalomma asiaticum TaxID=266040 RepID=A0ACB7TNT7_HYAAI|nr:hypothetical protein HPB50_021730 [Hyalomma asiaticum]